MTDFSKFKAPAFHNNEVQNFEFNGEGTYVLAFFPGAFTGACTEEMCQLRDSMSDFNELNTEVIGISVDTPFALKEFSDQNDLNFTLVSDTDNEIIENYDVKTQIPDLNYNIAERAVFLIKDGEIKYSEIMDNPENLPDLEALKNKVAKLH